MGFSIIVLALLPLVDTSYYRSNYFKPLNIYLFWFFVCTAVSLG